MAKLSRYSCGIICWRCVHRNEGIRYFNRVSCMQTHLHIPDDRWLDKKISRLWIWYNFSFRKDSGSFPHWKDKEMNCLNEAWELSELYLKIILLDLFFFFWYLINLIRLVVDWISHFKMVLKRMWSFNFWRLLQI